MALFRKPRIMSAANLATTAKAGTAGLPPLQVAGYILAQDPTGATIKIPYYLA
jgi:hypothetical protein